MLPIYRVEKKKLAPLRTQRHRGKTNGPVWPSKGLENTSVAGAFGDVAVAMIFVDGYLPGL
jgi:hypothetical protein